MPAPAGQGSAAGPGPGALPGAPAASPGADGSLSSAGPAPFLPGQDLLLDESSPLAKAGVDLVDSAQGLVLRVRDLRFVADSDEILVSEKWRLDAIAASLSGLKEGSFLVEGHSAAVGKPKGELELSALRAKRVVDELVSRGIAASRFIYRGLGSGSPIADNSTEEGRAKNRRVEITILN
jgi:outer membrane protein OmpA-like peptidoglycan-associated protein